MEFCKIGASGRGVDEESSFLECVDMHTDTELPTSLIYTLLPPSSGANNPQRENYITFKFP